MEIRTSNNSYICSESHDINDIMDAIVCALLLEGHYINTIRDALINKAKVMVEEFSFDERGKDEKDKDCI